MRRLWRRVRRRIFSSTTRLELRFAGDERWQGPVIDAHVHLGRDFAGQGGMFAGRWPERPVEELVAVLDAAGVEAVVDLDGGWGARLDEEIERYQRKYPERFYVLCGLDYASFARDRSFGSVEAERLRRSAAMGARGLKVWKLLGLHVRDLHGHLVGLDDERLDPLWAAAAEEHMPVVIHVGDPWAFFWPLDGNPRRSELEAHPDWHFHPTRPPGDRSHPDFPSHDEVLDQFEMLLARHRGTTFVAAHLASLGHDLTRLSVLIDRYPNLHIDTAGRLTELAADPEGARRLFIRHEDRILFGTDTPPDRLWYRMHRRFFATEARSIAYHRGEWPAGDPFVLRGLGLPEGVLRKVGRDNARRIFAGHAADGGS